MPQEKPGCAGRVPGRLRRLFRIAGGLSLAALALVPAACARRGEVTLPPEASDRLDDATQALTEAFLMEGIPSASDPVYSRRGSVSPEVIRSVRQDVSVHGRVSGVDAGWCVVFSGTATCKAKFAAEAAPGTAFVLWAKEGRTWKVASFRVAYEGQRILVEGASGGG